MRFLVPLLACLAAAHLTLVGIVVFQISTRDRSAWSGQDPQMRLISTGRRVDLAQHVQPHGLTVIEFLGVFAPACRKLGPRLLAATQRRPDVRVRVVDIVSYDSDVAKQYDIEEVPALWLYRDGRLVATDADTVWRLLDAAN